MLNYTAFFLLCALTVGCTKGQAQPSGTPHPSAPLGQSGDWQLIFRDEYEGDALDTDKWVTCYWWDDEGCTNKGNHELEWYRPENVFVSGGKLILRAEKERVSVSGGQVFDYTSGMVSTGRDIDDLTIEPKFSFKHAYVEMKAKVPEGRGLWPALWLLPADHKAKPEVDILEILGHDLSTLHMNFHYLDEEGNYNNAGHTWVSPKPLTGWHVFALDWQPRGLTWYVDGVKRAHFSGEKSYVPDEPMYLIANLAVGGDWPGAPDENTSFPSDFEIDYLRVWMRD